MSADFKSDHKNLAEDDGLEPWERCGCGACQATMAVLYGDPDDYWPNRELGYGSLESDEKQADG